MNKYPELQIAGMVPWSSVDWPGHLAAVVFLQGCPLNCTYCHNTDLIPTRTPGKVQWSEVLSHLALRRGLLDGVVFSGGEPLRQRDVVAAASDVVRAGNRGLFQVGVHTSGMYPNRLAEMIDLGVVHWVGLDVKTSDAGIGCWGRTTKPAESLAMLVESTTPHEVRITVTPERVGEIPTLCDEVRTYTEAPIYIQPARGYEWVEPVQPPEDIPGVSIRH